MNPFKPEVLDAMRTQVQAVAEGKVFSAQMVTQAQEALLALDTLTSFGQALEELLGAFSAFNLKPAPSPAATHLSTSGINCDDPILAAETERKAQAIRAALPDYTGPADGMVRPGPSLMTGITNRR